MAPLRGSRPSPELTHEGALCHGGEERRARQVTISQTFGANAVDWENRVDMGRLRAERLARLNAELERSELGALLSFDFANIRYMTATHIGTWAVDKLIRFALLPRGGKPVVWDFGSAARHHQLYNPWLDYTDGPATPEGAAQTGARAGISTLRGAFHPHAGIAELPPGLAGLGELPEGLPHCRRQRALVARLRAAGRADHAARRRAESQLFRLAQGLPAHRTDFQRGQIAQLTEQHHLKARQPRPGRVFGPAQFAQGSQGFLKESWMWVVLFRPAVQQLGDIVGRIQGRQVARQLRKPFDDLRLREQVETTGRFAEEDYTADGQEVKCRFKGRLEPFAALGQRAHLAELTCPERADATGFAPVGGAQDQGRGFGGGHEGILRGRLSI